MPLNVLLFPEFLIIHSKYITFQLTNCQALEISPEHFASGRSPAAMEAISSPVFLTHSDLKGK